MENSLVLAVGLFAFVMSATPGPNNIMLLASGAQFGYKKTLPHILGILIGIALLLFSVLFGLGVVFKLYPVIYDLLKVFGSIYLLWLAWKIATSATQTSDNKEDHIKGKPMSLFSAVVFQFINPKAWAMAITAVSTFTLPGEQYVASSILIMTAFALIGFFSISFWAYLGVALQRLLTTVKRRKYFNWLMGLCTAATLMLVLFD